MSATSEMLDELRQCYLLNKLPSMDALESCIAMNQFHQLYERTIGQNINVPPIQCRIKWVKLIIKKLEKQKEERPGNEDEDEELASRWYEALETLFKHDPQVETFFRLYQDDTVKGSAIKMFENETAFVSNGTTGLVTWEASIELAKYFNRHQEMLNCSWILELGCGCGYLAISVAKLKTNLRRYIATDGSLDALNQCEKNVKANFSVPRKPKASTNVDICFQKFDWCDTNDIDEFVSTVKESTQEYRTGLLIGADIVFDENLIPSLVASIKIFLTIQKSELNSYHHGGVLLSCAIRNESTMRCLWRNLDSNNIAYEVICSWAKGNIFMVR